MTGSRFATYARRTVASAVVPSLLLAALAPAAFAAPSTETSAGVDRRPPDTSSAIDVNVDEKTAAFRKELAEKQARLDEFNAQLDALDRELELASEQYNTALDRLNQLRDQVQVAQNDLDTARGAYETQVALLGERATSIYKNGSMAGMQILLDSKSVSDFVSRVKFLNTIGLSDAQIASSLKGQKDQMEQRMAELKNAQATAASLEFELRARQIEVQLRVADRQAMLAAAQSDLLALLDTEASRRQQEEAQLLADVLSGASKAGIVVEPGSPVETALAYHGIPYLWGGETPAGFDCSGLVKYVFAQHGVSLPHYSGSQFLLGDRIAPAALQPGDVVFFGSPIHHVGIYLGGGYFIHAPRTGDFVKISKLADRTDYAGARRYAWTKRQGPPASGVLANPASALFNLP